MEGVVHTIAPDRGGKVIRFDDIVRINALVKITAGAEGKDKLNAETFVDIYDLQGNLLQEVEFHTSIRNRLI